MKRRNVLKAGVVFAACSPAAAFAPNRDEIPAIEPHDPRREVRRLSARISELLDSIDDYESVVIQAKSVGPWAVYTQFTV